jgi:hypothetical protein
MNPEEVAFDHKQSVLAGADFGDSYRIAVTGQNLSPVEAARRAVYGAPSWINTLLRLRTILVKPFGLKPGMDPARGKEGPKNIGIFPVLESQPSRLVLGLNDKHLDFRLLVDVEEKGNGRQFVTASTMVKTHNLLGRVYLACVKPFHRVIVPTMLRQVSRPCVDTCSAKSDLNRIAAASCWLCQIRFATLCASSARQSFNARPLSRCNLPCETFRPSLRRRGGANRQPR